MLPGSPTIHEIRSPRLPVEPVQRRSDQGPILRQAAASDAAQLALAVVVPPTASQDYDCRTGETLSVA